MKNNLKSGGHWFRTIRLQDAMPKLNQVMAPMQLYVTSNLLYQGLESTAVFDREKDEFVLNTPTITATKYWPGEMGLYANHAIVMARLIIDGKDFGV